MVQEAWRACHQVEGQIVSIVGEAGSGESRLLHEFRQGLDSGEVRWLAAGCPSSYRPGPYELVADLFRGLLGLMPSLDGSEASRKVAAALGRVWRGATSEFDLAEDLAILDEILAVAAPRELPRPQVEPRARQRRIVALLGRLLARHAADGPLIVMVDDLHWADDASVEVLNQLRGGLERLPVLLIALFRSETAWQPPWWNRQTSPLAAAGCALGGRERRPVGCVARTRGRSRRPGQRDPGSGRREPVLSAGSWR